jgi:CheY-like chemotaxis protein
MTVHVAVVDDDDITLLGSTAILDKCPGIEVEASVSHEAALDGAFSWDGIDVVLVDASDRRFSDDHFPGVLVVQRIRASRTSQQTRVIVLTGVMFDDAIRRRMREAGADFYYHRSELLDAAVLCRVVLQPEASVPEPEDVERLFRLGIGDSTRVNEAVQAARDEGLLSGESVGGRGRDRIRRRERFARRAGLHVVTADGRPPDREQQAPSLPQIDRFLRWATRLRELGRD